MKGNDKWLRRRHGYKWKAVTLLSILLMVAYKVWDILSLGQGGAFRRGKQWEHAKRRFGGNRKQANKIRGSHLSVPEEEREESVLEARVHLVDITIPPQALSPNKEGSYSGVVAYFCEVDWELQKDNPSSVAMFRDLMRQSQACQSNKKFPVDLGYIVERARAFDKQSRGIYALPPKAFVFHETRCGSTLVANLLAGFDPPTSRVYSESPPPVTALKACEGLSPSTCDPSKAAQLLRDVVYLMGRTNDIMEQNIFFKIQSVGGRSISVFREAFPTTPWLFVYRDSVEVVMSHYKNELSDRAVCMRSLKKPMPVLTNLVERHGFKTGSLTKEQFCAAHLASLCESAIAEHEKSHTGRFVNYADLPDIMWESILPEYLGVDVDETRIANMKKIAESYSKGGRGGKTNRIFDGDSEKKQAAAPDEVKEACRIFMKPAYDKMEAFSQEGQSE